MMFDGADNILLELPIPRGYRIDHDSFKLYALSCSTLIAFSCSFTFLSFLFLICLVSFSNLGFFHFTDHPLFHHSDSSIIMQERNNKKTNER